MAKKGTTAPKKASVAKDVSPFTRRDGSPMRWTADGLTVLKALKGTTSGSGHDYPRLEKLTKLDKARIGHYLYHGLKAGIIGDIRNDGEGRTFFLTPKGTKLSLPAKV